MDWSPLKFSDTEPERHIVVLRHREFIENDKSQAWLFTKFLYKEMIICPRIDLEEKGFGVFNDSVIRCLLESVKDYYSSVGVDSEKQILILHRDGQPMCCKSPEDSTHIILLSASENYWCQWVYQFAHEYCHHLIDGELTGETSGLKWFEESLCHVASFVCLLNFARICEIDPSLRFYVPCVYLYVRDLLSEEESKKPDLSCFLDSLMRPISKDRMQPLHHFIETRMGVLTTTYSTEDYKIIARALFPHFYNNEKLWRIIPYLGETAKWISLQGLLVHLLEKADNEYKESLEGVIKCLA